MLAGKIKHRMTIIRSKNKEKINIILVYLNKTFTKKTVLYVLPFVVLCLLTWTLLQTTRITAILTTLRQEFIQNFLSSSKIFKNAENNLQKNEFGVAKNNFNQIVEIINNSKQNFEKIEKEFLGITGIIPKTKSAKKLLSATSNLAKAGDNLSDFFAFVSNYEFSTKGLVRGKTSLNDLLNKLNSIEEHINLAIIDLKEVPINHLPKEFQDKYKDNLIFLEQLKLTLDDIKLFSKITEIFLSKSLNVLAVFQNQNEIRPTGGFIGSFGIIKLQNGEITEIKTSSIYDLDGQLRENIKPPWPILNVNYRWFLRDANWFSDFAISGKKIVEFFEKEGGETPDIVIGITPKSISDFLKITGPIKTQSGATIDSENFVELIQILGQENRSDSVNEPKKILGELFLLITQKLSKTTFQDKLKILESINDNLIQKNFLFYSPNQQYQKIFKQLDWSGEVKQTEKDYLLITNANLGGTKTDLFIKQKIILNTFINSNSEIINKLTIERTNTLPNIPNSHNLVFTKILVPQNSKLISANGFDRISIEKNSALENFIYDKDELHWQTKQIEDINSGTVIGEESGKTFFGNWIKSNGGETKTVELEYKLPFKLNKIDAFSLLHQKQPGSKNDDEFQYSIFSKAFNINWSTFPELAINKSQITINRLLNKDYFFGNILVENK